MEPTLRGSDLQKRLITQHLLHIAAQLLGRCLGCGQVNNTSTGVAETFKMEPRPSTFAGYEDLHERHVNEVKDLHKDGVCRSRYIFSMGSFLSQTGWSDYRARYKRVQGPCKCVKEAQGWDTICSACRSARARNFARTAGCKRNS